MRITMGKETAQRLLVKHFNKRLTHPISHTEIKFPKDDRNELEFAVVFIPDREAEKVEVKKVEMVHRVDRESAKWEAEKAEDTPNSKHTCTYRWTGGIPNTGIYACVHCGEEKELPRIQERKRKGESFLKGSINRTMTLSEALTVLNICNSDEDPITICALYAEPDIWRVPKDETPQDLVKYYDNSDYAKDIKIVFFDKSGPWQEGTLEDMAKDRLYE